MVDLRTLKRDIIFPAKLRGFDLHFHSTWGLFSPRSVDEGTRLLVDQLDINEGEICLDIGCGYGAVGIVMARLSRTPLVMSPASRNGLLPMTNISTEV